MEFPRVPYDLELGAFLAKMPPSQLSLETIPLIRQYFATTYTVESVLAERAVTHEERTIPGPGGDLIVSIFRSKNSSPDGNKPGIYFIHGGGLMVGNRFLGIKECAADWVEELDAVLVTIEYRLAPEHPDPAPVEDCYAGLKWVAENFEELKIDPKRLMISGQSAGGGIAAGVALLVRDRGGPSLCAQHLQYPMLDDRNETLSSRQYTDGGSWTRTSNLLGWKCLLGDRVAGKDVSIYASPARATDLSGLPPTFLEVGSAEVFRDEDVAYASRLWACGVQTEFHVWPGVWHGSDLLVLTAALTQAARTTRNAWVRRTLSSPLEI